MLVLQRISDGISEHLAVQEERRPECYRAPRQSHLSILLGEPLPNFICKLSVCRILFLVTHHIDPNINLVTVGQSVSILTALELQKYVIRTL